MREMLDLLLLLQLLMLPKSIEILHLLSFDFLQVGEIIVIVTFADGSLLHFQDGLQRLY
jgi:hypothetical protein